MLLRVLKAYLRDVPGVESAPRAPTGKLDARAAVRVLLATVAAFGSEQAGAARAAYEAGIASRRLAHRAGSSDVRAAGGAARSRAASTPRSPRSTSIRPRDKERVLRGVLATIRADAVTGVEERELFRVIAIALDCPLPPDVATLAPAGALPVFR